MGAEKSRANLGFSCGSPDVIGYYRALPLSWPCSLFAPCGGGGFYPLLGSDPFSHLWGEGRCLSALPGVLCPGLSLRPGQIVQTPRERRLPGPATNIFVLTKILDRKQPEGENGVFSLWTLSFLIRKFYKRISPTRRRRNKLQPIHLPGCGKRSFEPSWKAERRAVGSRKDHSAPETKLKLHKCGAFTFPSNDRPVQAG